MSFGNWYAWIASRLHPLAPLLPAFLLFAFGVGGAAALDTIDVNMDRAKLVRLPDGAATIVVGNPAIADISMQRNGVVVITGRRAGRTNFIALDRKGAIISETMVVVALSNDGRVVLRRGVEATSYDCFSECLPAALYGDEDKSFRAQLGQAEARTKEAAEASKPVR